MTKTRSVLVIKPLTHEGRCYVQGDRLEVRPTQALALRRKGLVTLTRGVTVERPPDPEPEPPPRRRRQTYRTRHLEAETPADVTTE